jgi:hypothetical protein
MAIKTFTTGEVLTASDTNTYLNDSGLVLITSGITVSSTGGTAATVASGTVTVGTNNTAVTVNGAFSATYNNYKIIYTGGVASASADLRLTIGASATGYFGNLIYARPNAATPAGVANNNTNFWQYGAGLSSTTNVVSSFEIYQPFQALRTGLFTQVIHIDGAASALGTFIGFHDVATSYTSFTITPSAGNLTGGTIRVYGYRQS